MHLPRPDARVRLAVFADDEAAPVRLEMIEFPDPDARGAPLVEARPLRPGRFVFGFEVDSLGAALGGHPGAAWSKTCRIGVDLAVAGLAPGGVGFELRSSRAP